MCNYHACPERVAFIANVSWEKNSYGEEVACGDGQPYGEGDRAGYVGGVVIVGSGGEHHGHEEEGDEELDAEGLE